MSTQDLYEQIEAYLSGSLSESELLDFEAKLQSDPDLAVEVELMKELDLAISDQPVVNFQKLVQSEGAAFQKKLESDVAPVKQIGGRNTRFYLGVAATLLFLIASILFLWNNQSSGQLSGKELFAANFDTYNLDQNIRGGDGSTNDSAFDLAIQQYQKKNYIAATASFQQQVRSEPDDMILAFCLANAALNQKPPSISIAETQLRKIITEGESIYVPRSKWYLSLILLEQEKLEEAKTLLRELENTPDNLGTKAKAILKQLDS